MNIKEWEKVQPTVVQWSMHNEYDVSNVNEEEFEVKWGEVRLDLDVNHSNGVYDAYVDSGRGSAGRYSGVVVKDGKFDPVETSKAVHNASLVAWKGESDHVFIEKLKWNEDLNAFVAEMGS